MQKLRSVFTCQQCGHQSPRWLGRCPDCGGWNSMVEEAVLPASVGASPGAGGAEPCPIGEVTLENWRRLPSGLGELDRVLGGGVVPGSLVLVGGDPGIGKSTLLIQAAGAMAQEGRRILYVTGEESAQQVRLRADRLGTVAPELYLLAETDVSAIEHHAARLRPDCLVLDSIQTACDPEVGSAPGTVSQVRACAARLSRLAKTGGTACFLVGHVTKEGTLAGPRVLEHMVDCVLYFEGERFQSHRVLRAVKNRFGSSDEIGLFEMTDRGLLGVAGASELFLSQRPAEAAGSAVTTVLEGTRPLMVEVQALVARSYLNSPRRTVNGADYNRASMLLAVLERRCGLRFGDKDVFLNVTGGLKVVEPAADLAVALALAGSYRNRPLPADLAVVGEVGLSGEVRAVSQTERRLREMARMGFRRALAGPGARDEPGIEVRRVTTLREALDEVMAGPPVPGDADDPFAD